MSLQCRLEALGDVRSPTTVRNEQSQLRSVLAERREVKPGIPTP
jgi:hypothetical protein